jgi:hypothetical protein
MSSFTTPLSVSPLGDGVTWELLKPFVYHIGSKFSRHYIRVPTGFKTDFASVPKIFRFFLPEWAKFSKAPVLHDWLYRKPIIVGKRTHEISRKEADKIFLEAMYVDWRNHKSRYFIAKIEYWAVRIFGGFAWR